jgi:hypothetical protein
MRRTFSRAAILAGLLLGPAAVAQPPQNQIPIPRIVSALPCGAQVGTAVEVTVSGTDLDDATELLFSHPKIAAEIVPEEKPEAKAKEPKKRGGRRRGGGTPAKVKFLVTVPADVPVGQYDVRLVNRFGVSNPRAFVVGDRPEVEELEPNDDALPPDPTVAAAAGAPAILPRPNAPRAQRVELGTTINGVIGSPTDVDYVLFAGKAGQRVLLSCLTSSIDSRAKPLVELYEPTGKRLGLNRNYKDGDALLDATLPADGDYFVRVSEFAYQQGGPDYFYRLTVGAGPWIDAVFPPAIRPDGPTKVTLYGHNLPGGRAVPGSRLESLTVTVNPPSDPAARTRFAYRGHVPPPRGLQDAFEYRLTGPHGASNAVPIFLTDRKVVAETEPNDKPDAAQPIPVPCEVAGRIDRRNDRDFYSFNAKKGDVLFIELFAEQNGSLSDLSLQVRDEKDKVISPQLDDDQDTLHPIGFFTRCGDPPAYKFTAPADGPYRILVRGLDAGVSYGPRCFYRLRVGPPVPDFRAVVMAHSRELPAAVTARPDGEVAYDVYVHRTGGFTDPVTVMAKNLPPGVTCKPTIVGSHTNWGTLVLSAAAGAKEFTGPIVVTCSATIHGKEITREARPATITWGLPQGQNTPAITRLDLQLDFAVRPDRSPYRITTDLTAARVKTQGKDGKEKEEKVTSPFYLKPGDKLTVPVKVAWHEKDARKSPLTIQAEPTQQNPQQMPLAVNNTQIAADKNDGTVTIDVRPNAVPGTYAVALHGTTQIPFVRDPEKKDQKTNVNVPAYVQPIEVTVLPKSLAKLSARASGNLKPGATGELVVRVERQFDYAGEFKVSVALPKDARGVTVKDVTIPAGKDEVKVPVRVAKDARPGAINNVVVTAVATVHDKFPIDHETKVNLTVAK